MAHLITIPKLGLTMTDCTLTEWHKGDGDLVERGELLFSIETDKITSEGTAESAGKVTLSDFPSIITGN